MSRKNPPSLRMTTLCRAILAHERYICLTVIQESITSWAPVLACGDAKRENLITIKLFLKHVS